MGIENSVWIRYLESMGEDPKTTKIAYKFVDQFGSNPESQDHLYDLVVEGRKKAHVDFLTGECIRIGREFSEAMPVVFEEFEVAFS